MYDKYIVFFFSLTFFQKIYTRKKNNRKTKNETKAHNLTLKFRNSFICRIKYIINDLMIFCRTENTIVR